MFGLDFGEMILILIVGIVVVGPRNLPTLMRTAGRWVSKLRRMSSELRSQSGIDDLIRQEGLEKELSELRALSRVNVIDTFMAPVLGGAAAGGAVAKPKPTTPPTPAPVGDEPEREREYPTIGCDGYELTADDASPYPEKAAPEPKVETPATASLERADASRSDPKPSSNDANPARASDAAEPVAEAQAAKAPAAAAPPHTPANGTSR